MKRAGEFLQDAVNAVTRDSSIAPAVGGLGRAEMSDVGGYYSTTPALTMGCCADGNSPHFGDGPSPVVLDDGRIQLTAKLPL
jgi:hypothetical protein